MKSSRLWASILVFIALAATLLGVEIGTDRTPVLGLDLKGGLSVIYATSEPASQDDLVVVRDLMRDQLESFGIAEPDVRVEGENIIVDLPGVTDQEQAFEALKVSGIVELRPVIQCSPLAPPADDATTTGTTSPTGTTVPASSSDESTGSSESASGHLPATPARAAFRTAPKATPSTSTPATTEPTTTEPTATGPTATEPATTAPDDGATATTPTTDPLAVPTSQPGVFGPTLPPPTTEPPPPPEPGDPADPNSQATLFNTDRTEVCIVGPTGGSGEVFSRGSAAAGINPNTGGWVVTVDLRGDGQATWNNLASQCYNAAATCPSGRLAIVLDGVIQSAPSVNTPSFPDNVEISGAFSESEVRSLARVLNRGAFPVAIEQQRVETVSPTAGQNSLNSAIIAGLIGIGIMLTFMIAYYRKLAVVIIGGLAVWGITVFALASFVSNTWNFALTLAGATGIIVAVGVTVDTYVVFFERIRDETRHGRSLLNAAPRSFASSWRTIFAADLVSLLASFILFWLSVGSVKGFALYLGLTTICDLLVFYFVTRPAVYLLAQSRWFDDRRRTVAPAGGAS